MLGKGMIAWRSNYLKANAAFRTLQPSLDGRSGPDYA